MNEPTGDNDAIMRARELEIEVARLNAELETLRGEGEPTDIAARFLSMAASTVDQALTDARREADELAIEVSAAAEARRDEATRIAEEAEARTDALKSEAADAEQVVEQARTDAAEITKAAEVEAEELIATERARVADEIERLSSVRTALEDERGALEAYHEELKRRVQELAESMVAFMTTEPPIAAAAAIEDLAAPELAVVSDPTAVIDTDADTDIDDDIDDGIADVAEDDPVEPTVAEIDDTEDDLADTDIDEPAAFEAVTDDEMVVEDDDAAVEDDDAEADTVIEAPAAEVTEIEDEPAEEIDDEPVAETVSPFAAFAVTAEPELDETDEVDEAEMVAELDESDDVEIEMADDEPAEEIEEAPVAESTSPIDWNATSEPMLPEPDVVSPFAVAPPSFETPIAGTIDEPVAEAPAANPFAEPGVPAKPVEPSAFYDAPAGGSPSFADMMAPPAPPVPPAPAGPATEPTPEPVETTETAEFGGAPVVEREVTSAGLPTRRPRLGGLFGRGNATPAPAPEPEAEDAAPTAPAGGLFGSHGARLIEQTSPEDLAKALSEDSVEDERFRTFIDGDDDSDPSRDWLLRPEQS